MQLSPTHSETFCAIRRYKIWSFSRSWQVLRINTAIGCWRKVRFLNLCTSWRKITLGFRWSSRMRSWRYILSRQGPGAITGIWAITKYTIPEMFFTGMEENYRNKMPMYLSSWNVSIKVFKDLLIPCWTRHNFSQVTRITTSLTFLCKHLGLRSWIDSCGGTTEYQKWWW